MTGKADRITPRLSKCGHKPFSVRRPLPWNSAVFNRAKAADEDNLKAGDFFGSLELEGVMSFETPSMNYGTCNCF